MNRLQQADLALDSRSSRKQVTSDSHCSQHQRVAPHRVFIPLHYEDNYAYPLIVWLHGPTGSEYEIKQVMPHISVRNYVGVSPRGCVKHEATHTDGAPTYTWDQHSESVAFACEDVMQCVSLVKKRFHVADDRVFLAGHDVGGTMALRLALAAPDRFAGAASLGGALPDSKTPLASVNQARSMPIFIAHSRDSQVYSTDDVCDDLRLLHAAGMCVTIRQYPCDQEVTTQMLSDLNNWVMERVAGVPAQSTLIDDPTHMRVKDRN